MTDKDKLIHFQSLFLTIQKGLYELSDKYNDMESFEEYVKTELPNEIEQLKNNIKEKTKEDLKKYIKQHISDIKEINSNYKYTEVEDGRKSRNLDNIGKKVSNKSGKKVSNKRRLSVRRGSRRGVISRRRR